MACLRCNGLAFPETAYDTYAMTEIDEDGKILPRRHFAVRFGDLDVVPYLDGTEFLDGAVEAMTGEDGYIIYCPRHDDGHRHKCDCGLMPETAIVRGNVEVRFP